MKRQRTYRDDTNVEHNGQDYQDGWDNEMERRSEEDRERRGEFKPCEDCMSPTMCKWFGTKCTNGYVKSLTSK